MNYYSYRAVFADKAKGLPVNACRQAIRDAERTLEILDSNNCAYEAAYVVRLNAKIDALSERIEQLNASR